MSMENLRLTLIHAKGAGLQIYCISWGTLGGNPISERFLGTSTNLLSLESQVEGNLNAYNTSSNESCQLVLPK